jgi:hypothetical protein
MGVPANSETRVSEITWYSRFAIWVGAIVLLVQAVAGRGAGFMSLVSVILMSVGLAGFVFGLIWDGRERRVIPQEAVAVPNVAPNLEETDATAADATAEAPVAAPDSEEAELPMEEEPEIAAPAPLEPEVQVATASAPQPAAGNNRVETEEISIGSVLIGRPCIRCGNPLLLDQMAATCPVCKNPQHAACWIENHFRCSTPGCAGRGSLEAPKSSGDE